jgi:hypothetical protein
MNTKRSGHVIEDGDMSANISRVTVDLQGGRWFSVQLYAASGTHAGTVTIDTSDDGTNWETITTRTVTASAAYSDILDNLQISTKFLGIAYTRSSGTGTLQVYVHPKRRM